MSLKKPALDPMTIEPRTGAGYPEPYRSRVTPREITALGSQDEGLYSEVDLRWNSPDARGIFTRKDGSRF